MKQLFISSFLSFFICLSLFGQNEKDYPYMYRIMLKDTLKPSPVLINPYEKKSKTAQFSGRLIDILNLPVFYATIYAKSKDTSVLFGTNVKGEFSYPLPSGEYTLTVTSLQYSSTSFQLNWNGACGFEYLINLGRKSRGGPYIIYSKKELNHVKLEEIKGCLWYNLSNPGSCSNAGVYLVMGEG